MFGGDIIAELVARLLAGNWFGSLPSDPVKRIGSTSTIPGEVQMQPNANSVYVGSRSNVGDALVTVDGRPLSPLPSQRVWNHSPDGFEWGYGGSGPAQLALALLLHATAGNTITALDYYQNFKWDVVAKWPRTGWATTRAAVMQWLAARICPLDMPECPKEGGAK